MQREKEGRWSKSGQRATVWLCRIFKRKRVAALSRWPLSLWIGSCLWSVPLDPTKRAEAHQDGSVSASVSQMRWPKPKASKALFKDFTRTLETARPRFGVCRRAEAMWQMINFSGRLETHGAGGGITRSRGDLREYRAKEKSCAADKFTFTVLHLNANLNLDRKVTRDQLRGREECLGL